MYSTFFISLHTQRREKIQKKGRKKEMNQYEIWLAKEQQWNDDRIKAAAQRNRRYLLLCPLLFALVSSAINLFSGGEIRNVLTSALGGAVFGAAAALIALPILHFFGHKTSSESYMEALKKQTALLSPEQREEMALQLMSADAVCIRYKTDMNSAYPYEKAVAAKDYFLSSAYGTDHPLLLKLDQVSQVQTDIQSFSYRAGSGGYRLGIKQYYYTIQFCFYDKNPALSDKTEATIMLDHQDIRDQIVEAIKRQARI